MKPINFNSTLSSIEEKNHTLYQAIGEIDPDILWEVEEIQKKPVQKPKKIAAKNKGLWVAVACVLLMGASNNSLVRDLIGGGRIQFHPSGGGFRGSFTSLEGRVYEEQENQLFYIFESSLLSKKQENITAYCSETDYYFVPRIDEGGTGTIIVVGGEQGDRGTLLMHYERGDLVTIESHHDAHPNGYGSIFYGIHSNGYKEDWARHVLYFLSPDDTISPEFWGSNLPHTLENHYGTAEKVTDHGYWVQGSNPGPYTMYEARSIAMLEAQALTGGLEADFICEDWNNPYDFSLLLILYLPLDESSHHENPLELEKAHEILQELCDSYTLQVAVNDAETIGNSTYLTPRTIYEVIVTPEGREVTIESQHPSLLQ